MMASNLVKQLPARGLSAAAASCIVLELHGENTIHATGAWSLPVRYVQDLFETVDQIHLIKIDVDDRESYEAVFAGVSPVFHKAEIVQIEMLLVEELTWDISLLRNLGRVPSGGIGFRVPVI